MDDEFTSVKLPWSKEFPTLVLTIFLFSIFLYTVMSYRLLIIWIERIFYADDLNRVFVDIDDIDEIIEHEIEVKSYKFKAPGLIKKITNTYFAKSKEEDMLKIKRRLKRLIK